MLQDLFERNKVVFTVSTSIASVLTAWAGMLLPFSLIRVRKDIWIMWEENINVANQ